MGGSGNGVGAIARQRAVPIALLLALSLALPSAALAQTMDESGLSMGPRASQATDPYAEVTIESALKPGTSEVTPNSDPTGTPTQTAPASEANVPSLQFGQGREGVITVAAKYVLPKRMNPHGMTAGSFRITTTLPTGLTYVRANSAYADDVADAFDMTCTPEGQKVHCAVRTTSPEQAVETVAGNLTASTSTPARPATARSPDTLGPGPWCHSTPVRLRDRHSTSGAPCGTGRHDSARHLRASDRNVAHTGAEVRGARRNRCAIGDDTMGPGPSCHA